MTPTIDLEWIEEQIMRLRGASKVELPASTLKELLLIAKKQLESEELEQ